MTVDALAARLAAARPEAKLPCPRCGDAVKGANLERHLAKAHPGAGDPPTWWRGPEQVTARRLMVVGAVVAVAGIALATQITAEAVGLALGGAGALAVVVGGLATYGIGRFPGRLRVDEGGVVLRHGFGLGRRHLPGVDSVVLGRSIVEKTDPSSGPYVERSGTYLRLQSGRRAVVVRCRGAGELRATWTGWQQGPERQRADITISPADLAALQYALWDLGVLEPRP